MKSRPKENELEVIDFTTLKEPKSIGFIGKSGRVIAVTTILTFSLIGPMIQAKPTLLEEGITAGTSVMQNNNLVITNSETSLPSWVKGYVFCEDNFCYGDYSYCSVGNGCIAFHGICPNLYCDENFEGEI